MRKVLRMALLAAGAYAATAQAQQTSDSAIVVTATRAPTALEQLPARAEVIDRAAIERGDLTTLPQALGADAVQSGGVGAATSLFLRGANSNQSLALFDGVRLNDPSNATGLYNFGQDTLGALDRVEIVRGPLSAIYGSNAIGGVVNMIPRRGGPGAFIPFGEFEAGSFDTVRGLVGAAGAVSGFSYGASYEEYSTRGFDQLPERIVGHNGEPDGADLRTWTASARYDANRFGVDLLARRRDGRSDFDAGFPRAEDSTLHQESSQGLWRLGGDVALTDALTARLSGGEVSGSSSDFDLGAQTDRNAFDRNFADFTLAWRDVSAPVTAMTLGLSWEREHANVAGSLFADPLDASVEHRAAYLAVQSPMGWLGLTGSARLDDYDGFGVHASWGLGLTAHSDRARMYASYATAFRAPTLNERFSSGPFNVPNPDLDPEQSRSWEVGGDVILAQSGERDMLMLGATYYNTRVVDLIEYDFVSLQNINISRASMQGVETYVRLAPSTWLSLRLGYDYTNARDESAPGRPQLLRRPRNFWKVEAELRPAPALGIHAQWIWVGERADFAFDDLGNGAFTPSQIAGYNVGGLVVTYDATDRIQLFGRIDNLGDAHYEPTSGYAAAGLSAFFGIRAHS